DDPLNLGQQHASAKRFFVGNGNVLRAFLVGQGGVLRTNRWVIQTSRNRVRRRDLPMFILQNIGVSTLQHARQPSTEARCVVAQFVATSASFYPNQSHALLRDELMKNANSIGTTSDAGHNRSGKLPFCLDRKS